FLMGTMALLPGIPMLPFLGIAGAAGWVAWKAAGSKAQAGAEAAQAAQTAAHPPVAEEPISTALQIDEVRLELGYALLPLVSGENGHRLTDQIKGLRRQLAGEMGFVLPSVRIQDNMQLAANSYVLLIKEIESGRGELRPGTLLAMDPSGGTVQLPGEDTQEPTFGLAARWIREADREEAQFRGYTVVDPATVITTHLT